MNENRSSVGSLRATLTVDGQAHGGWQTGDVPDHDLPTGSYAAGGAKGTTVTVGLVRQGGTYTLTRKYDRVTYQKLKAPRSYNGQSLVIHEVDADDRVLSTTVRARGVVKGVTSSGLDLTSGDPLMMMVRFEADGDF